MGETFDLGVDGGRARRLAGRDFEAHLEGVLGGARDEVGLEQAKGPRGGVQGEVADANGFREDGRGRFESGGLGRGGLGRFLRFRLRRASGRQNAEKFRRGFAVLNHHAADPGPVGQKVEEPLVEANGCDAGERVARGRFGSQAVDRLAAEPPQVQLVG